MLHYVKQLEVSGGDAVAHCLIALCLSDLLASVLHCTQRCLTQCWRPSTDIFVCLWLQPHLPGSCAAVKKYTKYGVSEYGHVHTGPDFDADGIRVSTAVCYDISLIRIPAYEHVV